MRINSEMLTKTARDYVAKRLRQPNDIVAVYLTGSVISDEPLLGGTTDIDMVFVHKEDPPQSREVVRVTYEISFDIEHHHQSYYTYHRRLRQNPWIGFPLCYHGNSLHDTDHWLEFIQAGVSSQFENPENIHARAFKFGEKAREQWFDLNDEQELTFQEWVALYFKTVGAAANSVAALNGPALTIRRFMLAFPERAQALGQAQLSGELARLIGNDNISQTLYQDWRPAWENAVLSASAKPAFPPNLSRHRKGYFLNCCDAMAQGGALHAVLWPLLETWRQAAAVLADEPAQQEAWLQFLSVLGFTPDRKEDMLQDLDHFLDAGETILIDYRQTYGL